MSSVFPFYSFIRGEVTPKAKYRSDLDWHRTGLQTCENMLILPHGGVRKRSGTKYIADARVNNQKSLLIPFVSSIAGAFVLAFDDTHVSFFVNDGALTAAGLQYRIAHPFTASQAKIQFYQINDVMFMACEGFPPHKLKRTDTYTFVFEEILFNDGPFEDYAFDKAKHIVASGTTGTVTLTTTGFTFLATSVGSLIRLAEVDFTKVKQFDPTTSYISGEYVRSSGHVYLIVDLDTSSCVATGGTPTVVGGLVGTISDIPSHTLGIVRISDKDFGWQYIHSEYGVCKILSVSGNTAQAEVLSSRPFADKPDAVLPNSVVSCPTYKWALSIFSASSGYPSAVSGYGDRLVFGKGSSLYFSQTGNYSSFSSGVKATDAIVANMSLDKGNSIVWLDTYAGFLIAGMEGGYSAIRGSDGKTVAPNDIEQTYAGDAFLSSIRPIKADGSLTFLSKGGFNVYQLGYARNEGFQLPDISLLSDHIARLGGGIVDMAYQKSPHGIIWAVLANGKIAACTLIKDQSILGWGVHLLGGQYGGNAWGKAESVSVIPRENGGESVFFSVRRIISGVERVTIEKLGDAFEYQAASTGRFLDCYSESGDCAHLTGHIITTATNFGHNEVIAPVSPQPVYGGFGYKTKIKLMPIEQGAADGSAHGRKKRINRVVLYLFESGAVHKVFSQKGKETRLTAFPPSVNLQWNSETITDSFEVPVVDSWHNSDVVFESATPSPLTILGLSAFIDNDSTVR